MRLFLGKRRHWLVVLAGVTVPVAVLSVLLPSASSHRLVTGASARTAPRPRPYAATHPHVTPPRGDRESTFHLSFTARSDLGRQGHVTWYYVVRGAPAKRHSRSCPEISRSVSRGRKGQTIHMDLYPPSRGWCQGRYRISIVFDGRGAKTSVTAVPAGATRYTVH